MTCKNCGNPNSWANHLEDGTTYICIYCGKANEVKPLSPSPTQEAERRFGA